MNQPDGDSKLMAVHADVLSELAELRKSCQAYKERISELRVALREITNLPLGHHDAKKIALNALEGRVDDVERRNSAPAGETA